MTIRTSADVARILASQPRLKPAAAAPAAVDAPPRRAPLVDSLSIEDQAARDWRANPTVRAEFTSLAAYEAFLRHDRAGRVRIFKRSTQ